MIVALGQVGTAKVVVRLRVQDNLPAHRGESEDTPGRGDGVVIRAHVAEIDGQEAGDSCQPMRIVKGLGEGLSLAQHHQNTPEIAQWLER